MKSEILIVDGRFDILLQVRLSGVTKQGYTMVYGKSQIILIYGATTGLDSVPPKTARKSGRSLP